jgi:hypothetical protein
MVSYRWMSTKTRTEANSLAGVPIYPSNDPSVNASPPPSPVIVPASAGPVIVPVFNASDDSDSIQASIGEVLSEVFDIKVGFTTGIVALLARWRMIDVMEVS